MQGHRKLKGQKMQNFNIKEVKILPLDIKLINEVLNIENELKIHILSKENILKELNNQTFFYFVAIYHDEVIGYISLSLIYDIEIESIVVKKKYQRLGIGTLLIDYILHFATIHKINNIYLEVRKSNFPAISLYKKKGFLEVSIRKNYYDNSEDALILKKSQ